MMKLKAALGAAMVLLASTPADAAFLTYTIKAYGVGTREQQIPSSSLEIVTRSLNGAIITMGFFDVPGFGLGFGNDGQTSYGVENVNQQILFSFAPVPLQSNLLATGRGTLCAPNIAAGRVPQVSGDFSTNCGSLFYDLAAPRGLFRERFGGQVEFVTVTSAATGTPFFSIQGIIGGVPEPTTWAMMLTGFALTGYALRRRRARVSFA